MNDIKLVAAKAGLTNYYHNQVIRNPVMDFDSTLIDELTSENFAGGVSPSTLQRAAVHSGGLNATPSAFATIQEGWGTSKGLLMLQFVVQDSPVMVEYMNVIGYVSNNESMVGLTMSAMFHPTMSWRSQETITSTLDIANPTAVKRQVAGRTDYLFNDGSHDGGMVSLRPNDIIDYSIERSSHDDIMARMEEEGLDGVVPNITVASSDISRVGVVLSKRSNLNPSKYAADMLRAGTRFQSDNLITNNQMEPGLTTDLNDGLYGSLTDISYRASGTEPNLIRDSFFSTMMEIMGSSRMNGFTGYSIGDLLLAFDNLNDVLDLTFMSAEEYMVQDFTTNTENFGSSGLAELISHEIESNILDLMMRYGLAMISFRGSNCDNFGGDGQLDNIVILPYNPQSLQEDDFMLPQKLDSFREDLTSQIFAKINGLRPGQMTPLRFDVTAELFGNCIVNIMIVDESNNTIGFSIDDVGVPTGMQSRVFPTFACNTGGSVVGDTETAKVAGANFFSNIQAYFSN